MKAAVALILASAVFASASSARAAETTQPSPSVEQWIDTTLSEIGTHSTNPPRAARALAHLSEAMYFAAVLGGRDRDAVVSGAAAEVLDYFYPDHAAQFDALAGTRSAVARGRTIGAIMVQRAKQDGADAVWTGKPPIGDGLWSPTPPAFLATPLEPLAGTWRTWNLASGSELRPGLPPAYHSAAWWAELRAVRDVTAALTAEQRRIALFWADGAGTVTPAGHWNRIALELIADRNLNTVQVARVFDVLNTAQADAFIACWDAKFAYWSERPVTAIRRELDTTWTPQIATPPFPSYVSGHSTTSGAASTVLSHFFPRKTDELKAMADEAAISRLYGGIHFPVDNSTGLELGRRIGRTALRGNPPALVPSS